MATGKKGLTPKEQKLQDWVDARKRHRLSHAQVQMARELGMNPRRLGNFDNHDQQPWKAPLPLFIEGLYEKRFGRSRPESVVPMEERIRQSRERRKERKAERRRSRDAGEEGHSRSRLAASRVQAGALIPGDESWLDFDGPGSGWPSPSLEQRVALAGLADQPIASLSEGFSRLAAVVEARHGPLTCAALAQLLDGNRISKRATAMNLHSMLNRAACQRLRLRPESVLEMGREVLLCLRGREQRVALLRFRDGLTFAQIGNRLEVSSSRAQQIAKKAMRRCRITWGEHAETLHEPAVRICRTALREPAPARVGGELVAAQLVCWVVGRHTVLRALATHRRTGHR